MLDVGYLMCKRKVLPDETHLPAGGCNPLSGSDSWSVNFGFPLFDMNFPDELFEAGE